MTKYFEVQKRDGPARMGKLLLERLISTPALFTNDDYISAGSIYSYPDLDKTVQAAEALKGQKKLSIAPYAPSVLHNESAMQLPQVKIDGPKGLVIQPFCECLMEKADVYVIGKAGTLRNPKDLVSSLIKIRSMTPPDTALYVPALATPANLALLVYLGIDLFDSIRVVADGIYGLYHTRDGTWKCSELSQLPCRCKYCQKMLSDGRDRHLIIAHNVHKLEEELLCVREQIRTEAIREYVERQVRVTPDQTATLRLLDQEHQYLEKRTPQHRRSTLFANSAESLKRVEVSRFADRVLNRYKAPKSDVLLLLPCSAKKPYSTSKSHRLFAEATGSHRRYLHELILTSPLALVPRELEECYPAASYDVPVTGHWDKEERSWLLDCLDAYLERNKYDRIISHLEGELEETIKDHGIQADYTGGGKNEPSLERLSKSVAEACSSASRLPDLRIIRYRGVADFCFGQGAGDALLEGNIMVRGKEIQDENKRPLATITPNGTLALSLIGARRLEKLNKYIVTIGDFVPKGSLLAPGVIDADEQIRPGDEVIIRGEQAFGIGLARMSGWEMIESSRGVALELRHVEKT